MAVTGVEQTKSRLDQVKQFGGLVLVAMLVAALVIGALIITGLFSFVPAPQITVFSIALPSEATAFIGAFTLALVLILAYVNFASLVLSSLRKAWEFWLELPTRVQALVLGLEAGALAGLALYATSVLIRPFAVVTMLGAAAVVLVVVAAATLQATGAEWTIVEWARALNVSALVAGLVALLSAFVFSGVAPAYVPPAVFLAGWGICVFLLHRRRTGMGDSVVTRLLVNSGYAQMRQIETASVSVGSGLAAGLVVGILVGVAGTAPSGPLRRALLSVAVVWPVVTFATSVGWPDAERNDLVIDDISVRTSTELRELTVRNVGTRPVDLRGAKVIDATNEMYHIGFNQTLSAGGTAKFEIPEEFDLATHERYEISSLPRGLALMRDASEPEIVTLDGKAYVLVWIDQLDDGG